MKKPKDTTQPTVVLKKSGEDEFIDFDSPHDLAEVKKAIKKTINEQ